LDFSPMPASLPKNCVARPLAPGRGISRWLAAALGGLLLGALVACNGGAVVTLTSTPSTDTFLAYRVGLVSVQLQGSGGRNSVSLLPAGTTVDLARLVNLSEVVGSSSSVKTGTFKQAVVTLDYSSAQIIYDNGTTEGVTLTPMGAGGQALGRVTLTLLLDPSNQMSIAAKSTTRLSLDFNLAASNVVNLTAKTVSVMPMMAASSLPIDDKTVRIRGPIGTVNVTTSGTTNGPYSASVASNGWYSSGIMPFDFNTSEGGSLGVTPTTGAIYEINGIPSSGTTGLTQLASLSAGTMTEAFGTMTTSTSTSNSLFNNNNNTASANVTCSDGTTPQTVNGTLTCTDGATLGSTGASLTSETCSDGTTPVTVNGVLTCTDGSTLEATNTGTTGTTGTITTVSFQATQVLAGSSVQGGGFDRVSGIVTGRSGDTFTIDDATLLTNSGTNSLIFGTTTVTVGPNTLVTEFGEATPDTTGIAQISVGSLVYAFGTASAVTTTSATLDASAGRVRVGQTVASGLVTSQGTSGTTLTLNLSQLGGRSAAAFDFTGTGSTTGNDATAPAYVVSTGTADLTNASAGQPVQVTGYPAPFGSASSAGDFTEQSSFLDYTTINAVLALDWTGTSTPFASMNTAQLQLDAQNIGIGTRHFIQIGAQTFNVIGGTDPLIQPSLTGSNTVFTIGHSVSGSYENFNTFAAFVTQLQTELTGSVVATGITAIGQYASASYTFTASSVTLSLDN
jgi:hypothetical protein